ncbi:hypothetical protein B5M47_01845 [candidate division CPR3 bacterium 4484_211]|uniref:POTRA domain-containing protein n=1 Tax=candidate division CPR3 bacterium 4484_211 TaxID=1968527 RepID=A0A1W9NYS0_UNCC3|nr:MAG: hypothetical protein B5M47_01845 [candidate division CPR3 bacterium 4484_211]
MERSQGLKAKSCLDEIIGKILRQFIKARRLRRFRRAPKIFFPIPRHWIVISFKPIYVLLVLVLFACTVFLLIRSDIFLVRHLKFQLEEKSRIQVLSEEDLRDELSDCFAQSLLKLDTRFLENKLKERFLGLEEVFIQKKLPDTLIVNWRPRDGAAVIRSGDRMFLVDRADFIFAEVDSELSRRCREAGVPVVEGEWGWEIKVGSTLKSSHIDEILKVVFELGKDSRVSLSRVYLKDTAELEVFSSDGWKAIFDLEKDVDQQIEDLKVVVNKMGKENGGFREVDLRFKYPVVR